MMQPMRRFLLACALATACASAVFAEAGKPEASVSYAAFRTEEHPYVEVYLTVDGRSLGELPEGGRAADFTLVFRVDEEIRLADRVRLHAPVDSAAASFTEALRYRLPSGEYQLTVEATDAATAGGKEAAPTLRLVAEVAVAAADASAALSDIQLATGAFDAASAPSGSVLVKGGQLLEPLPQHFVRRGMRSVTSYVEAYLPAEAMGEGHLVEYTILALADGDAEAEPIVRRNVRFTPEAFATPFTTTIPTDRFGSGRYALQVTLRDRTLAELARRVTLFTVANPEVDAASLAVRSEGFDDSFAQDIPVDSLEYVLRAILPTLGVSESEYFEQLLNYGNEDAKRLAIYNHFLGESATLPAVAYRAYLKVAREVDIAFRSGFGYGFQMDRGWIYLKYGQPDDRVIVNDDPSAPPYEIWVYNFVERTQQAPGKFLFYNPVLDNASYDLLHSTVRGEINQPQWRRFLYSRSADEFVDPDAAQGTDVGDNVGRYADQYFNDN